MTNCIEIKGLVKEYKSFTLGPINLTVPGGSILGLIGENGAGKTTLIKSMLGIVKPSGGEVTLLGTDPDHAKEDIGIVMDDCFFSEYLRVKDVNSVLCRVYKGWDKGLFMDYLDKFGLAGTKNIKELSRGMRMKLSLAAALAHKPRLLLLDEATAGLDPVVRDEILDEFLAFVSDEDHAILISSHITSDLEKICDYVVYLHKGEVTISGAKDELLANYGKLSCSRADLAKIDPALVVGKREGDYGCQALINDRAVFQRSYPDLPLDTPTLEDLMIFTTRGDRK